jgi:hypothetical protein
MESSLKTIKYVGFGWVVPNAGVSCWCRRFSGSFPPWPLCLLIVLLSVQSRILAEDSDSTRSFRELDSEIQALKREVLEINRDLLMLEEDLLNPPEQQLVVLVSVTGKPSFRLDGIRLLMDGKALASHDYSIREDRALHNGGVHRIYTGKLVYGEHHLDVHLSGSGSDGLEFQQKGSSRIAKGITAKFIELRIEAGDNGQEPGIGIYEW